MEELLKFIETYSGKGLFNCLGSLYSSGRAGGGGGGSETSRSTGGDTTHVIRHVSGK
jgi:hypothetical protein